MIVETKRNLKTVTKLISNACRYTLLPKEMGRKKKKRLKILIHTREKIRIKSSKGRKVLCIHVLGIQTKEKKKYNSERL